jgi:DNA-binding beta-propeller fold protein YncE
VDRQEQQPVRFECGLDLRTLLSVKFMVKSLSPAVVALAILASGCGSSRPQEPLRVWPPPPLVPRIEYVGDLSSNQDLGLSFLGKLKRFLLGPGELEALAKPFGVYSDGAGAVFVTDTALDVVFVFDTARKKFWRFGGGGGPGVLVEPIEVIGTPNGHFCVSDSERGAIHFYDGDGKYLKSIGGPGVLERPTGLAVDPSRDRLYVVDTTRNKVLVFSTEGDSLFEFGERGDNEGEFYFPTGISVDGEGKIYVVDTFHFAIQVFSPDGQFLYAFGKAGRSPGLFARPKGIALDRWGNIYVTDSMTDNVQVFDGEGRLLLVFGGSGSGPGQFSVPSGIWIDAGQRLYVTDSLNRRVQIFRLLDENMDGGS